MEWFLNEQPLLFKSNYGPVYDHGFLSLAITKVTRQRVRERDRGGQSQKILTDNYWAKYSTTISISYVFISTSLILMDWLYSSALLYYK